MAERQRMTSSGQALRLLPDPAVGQNPESVVVSAQIDETGQATLELPGERRSVGLGRRWIVRAAADRGVNGMANQVLELLSSELLSNAVIHGVEGAPVGLQMRYTEQMLHVAVRDRGEHAPTVMHPGPDALAGRGMAIVEAMSTRWGVQAHEDGGKTVWFELDLADF